MIKIKKFIILAILSTYIVGCSKSDDTPNLPDVPITDETFYTGMDLSFQPFLKDYQVDYKDSQGNSVDNLLNFVKENGLLKQGKYPILYSAQDENAVGEDDIKDGDIDKVGLSEMSYILAELKNDSNEKKSYRYWRK